MNILWITLESILPANSGGRIGVFKRLEQVAKTEKIYLYYTYDNESELSYVSELKKYCVEVHHYKRNPKKAILNLLKYPYTVASRNIRAMQEDIRKCLEEKKIDVINVDFPHMCVNLLNINTNIPIVLNEHNIEWKVYQTISKSQKNILKKMAYKIDSYRLKVFEEKIFKKLQINRVTFVSDDDMNFMVRSGICNNEQVVLIPVGADLQQNVSRIKHDGKNIIFIGKMSYGPNIEAVTWFTNEILPLIHEKEKNVKFYIVGKDPTEYIKSLASEKVIVTGQVDSVDKYYSIADLVVLPLKNGGGVKVKLLEAIAYRSMVVSSSKGVEGTLYKDGKTVPIADDSKSFANYCIRGLQNDIEMKIRAEKAYELLKVNYFWTSIGERYLQCLREAGYDYGE